MALVGELELQSFDYTDPELKGERFHAALRELATQGWLAQGPYGYVVLDREAGEFFLRTRSAIFPGMKIAELFDVSDGPLWEEMKANILHVNGADHTRLRALVNPALTPRAVERWRPAMREFLSGLFAEVADAGRCEFVQAFAKPYPSQTIATVMGAPLSDAPRLHHWSNWIQRQFDAASMMNERDGIELAVQEFYEYARALIAARRDDPSDDLISTLLAATYHPVPEDADEGGPETTAVPADRALAERLSEEECVNLVLNVLIGGVDTTQSQLAHAIRLLAEHPEQWAALVADPSLAGAAVEEALRFEPITPFTARITVEEITYRDVTFPKDTVVMVCAFSGNRDLPTPSAKAIRGEAANGFATEDSWDFDITAQRPKARVLTFGAGVHYCLGANLARLELEEGLSFLAQNMPALELDGGAGGIEYESILGIYGLSQLPIRF
ncbi:MAG TPA: cytochrome P450 [Solirubrobacteraceae bacterium]|jgi:cytochrome P450|nr:cytochrome P450 [Solirubrobacteraceae bacterium]